MLRFLPVQSPSLSLAGPFRWMRHRSISHGSAVGVSRLVNYLFFAHARLFAHTSTSYCRPLRIKSVSLSLGRLLSTRARMSSIVFSPFPLSAKFHCAHTGASMMLLTSPTSARFSRYSRSLASPPLSHYTKTSGHATPAGPAHRLGRSSMWASICIRSKRVGRHGCEACAVADTLRPSVGCGRAGIRSSQPRRWRAFLLPHHLSVAAADVCPLSQDVLLGWRHVRSEASCARWCPDTTFLAGSVSGHVGDCRTRRRGP
jgi:hypothetical protein